MTKYVNEFYKFSTFSFWDRFCRDDTHIFFKEIIADDTLYHWKEKCKKVEQGFDWSLMKKMREIEIEDQKYRQEIEEISQSNADPNNNYIIELIRKQYLLDSVNQVFIDSLLTCCGYPGRDKLGIELEKVPFLVIQHSTSEKMEKYSRSDSSKKVKV